MEIEMNFYKILIDLRSKLRPDRCKAACEYLTSMDFTAKVYNNTLWVKVANINGDLVWMELSSPQVKAFSDNYFFED